MRWPIGLCAPLLVVGSAAAATIEIGPADNLQANVNALVPGDELVLRGGLYTLTSRFSIGVSGTAALPIVIRAKSGETPHLTRDPAQNTINIENASWLELRGIEVSGGSHGIRMLNADFITIDSCHVHDTGDVAISANVPGSTYQGLRLTNNHVHDTGGTGEGFYLGCNNAGCVMFASLIAGNHIHDTIAGTTQGDGIEVKHGSYDNVIRGNIIHDTRYPCILAYGSDGNPVNLIARNLMWSCGDHGIQVAADAVVENNLVLGAAGDGIHSQIHQGATPSNLVIRHNTVLNQGDAVRVSDIAGNVLVANNALYSAAGNGIRATGALAFLTTSGNVGTGATVGVSGGFDGSGNRATDFVDAAARDVHLVAGSKLIASGDPAHVAIADFDAAPRNAVADVGAYRFATACLAALSERTGLVAVRQGNDIVFGWDADANAVEYHVNAVAAKTGLVLPNLHRPPVVGSVGSAECDASAPATSCPDGLGMSDARPLVYYQVLSACGPGGDEEGP